MPVAFGLCVADEAEEAQCGKEGRQACVDHTGNHMCESPIQHGDVSYIVSAVQTSDTSSTAFWNCEVCGKPGLRACPCSAMPKGTCTDEAGLYCENHGDIRSIFDKKICI